jgi:PKD repeat protein
MMLLVIPGAVLAADLSVSGSVVDEDLSVTALAINPGSSSGHDVISANEPNTLRATVANTGGLAAGAFDVTIVIGAFTQTVNVASLGAGATTTVDFTYSPTATGAISIVTTTDSGSVIAESDEANNALTTPSAVYYNGYKGKRYTAGNDFTTVNTYTGRDGVVYSTGNAAYQSANWMSYSASFTAGPSSANLIIPSGATIVSARLYQSSNWDQTPGENAGALWTATFSGTTSGTVTPTASYIDRKGYGLYNYPSWVYMYDVTDKFNPASTNTWSLSYGSNLNVALYPAYMVVVFQDAATQTEKTIFINDECDLLWSRTTYNTNNAEATAYATFTGVDVTGMSNAKAIVFVAAVNEDGQSQFIFNDVDKDDFYISSTASTASTVSIKEFTLSNVVAGANTAKFQSRDATDGDNMQAQNVILVIEKSEGAVGITDFTATPATGDAPLDVTFAATTTGNVIGYAWDFDNDGDTDSTAQSPTYTYSTPGVYSVKLTITGISSSDAMTKTDMVTVKTPAPIVDFTYTTSGVVEPVLVDFDATNSGGAVTSWKWERSDDGGSTWAEFATIEDPQDVSFTDGTWSVRVTATGPDYSDTETKSNIISVGASDITVTVSPASINFGTMEAGVDETGSSTVDVDVTGGTAWTVTTSATNGGYMMAGTTPLHNLFEISNDGKTNWYDLSSNLEFLTGAAGVDGSQVADVKQAIASNDAPGAYSITLTFTGSMD